MPCHSLVCHVFDGILDCTIYVDYVYLEVLKYNKKMKWASLYPLLDYTAASGRVTDNRDRKSTAARVCIN